MAGTDNSVPTPQPHDTAPVSGATDAAGATAAAGVTAAPTTRNRLAVAALVLALAALLFSVWEGAYIVGWVLLPIAFVLSLVALLRRDARRRGLAALALVLSIVGGIAAPMAFLSSVGRAIDKAGGGTPTVVSPQATPVRGGQTQAPSSAPAAATQPQQAGGQGTRENPYPVGTEIATENWRIKVNSITPDATSKVLAANQFNDKPKSGQVYALVNLTATWLGEKKGNTLEIGVDYVTADGSVVDRTESMAVAPQPLGMKDLYRGAKATGNEVLVRPASDRGLVRIRPGILADEVFFQLP